MKISVAMTTYNGEKYIKEQLDSILNQTYKVDEIVICDDMSDDDTRNILRKYEYIYNNIIVCYNTKRLGYAANFKKALDLCSGDIIFLCDQDDFWDECRVEKIKNIFINNNILVITTKTVKFTDKIKKNKIGSALKKISLQKFLKHPNYLGMSMAFRREILEDKLYKSYSFKYCHDLLINIIAILKGSMFYTDKVVSYYRIHDNNTLGSISNINSNEVYKKRTKMLYEISSSIDEINKLTNNKVIFHYVSIYKKRYELTSRCKLHLYILNSVSFLFNIALVCILGDIKAIICKK